MFLELIKSNHELIIINLNDVSRIAKKNDKSIIYFISTRDFLEIEDEYEEIKDLILKTEGEKEDE